MKNIIGVIAVFVLFGFVDSTAQESPEPKAQRWVLPAPSTSGVSLEDALRRRRSVREFTREQLTDAELSQLLWAAQGITHPSGYRTAPSAGALYPLEIYVATRDGLFHYEPRQHHLMRVQTKDPRPALERAALDQDAVAAAPTVFVVSGIPRRTAAKYGGRAERYVLLEAGHVAQNLLLQAAALGLGAVPIGAFHDAKIREAMGLPNDEIPLYLVPVGHPRR